jgi:hypothetical protein
MLNSKLMSKRNVLFVAGGVLCLSVAAIALKGSSKDLIAGGTPEVHSLGVILASPHYQLFSEISFKITEGKIEDSLRESLSLKANIEKGFEKSQEESYLYVLNLYRIGILQKTLGNIQEEKKTWEELEGIICGSDPRSFLRNSSLSLVGSLSSNETSLREYFLDRNKVLDTASSK